MLSLLPGHGRRLRAGAPWVFSNEIAWRPEFRQLQPGTAVRVEGAEGWRYGTFVFNPRSLIAARLLDRDPGAVIDEGWLSARIDAAVRLRQRVCDTPYYRLVHAEADGLPGLIVDRYDDVLVLQANTAGMDRLLSPLVEALVRGMAPRAVVARNDSAARELEGLTPVVAVVHGGDPTAIVEEAGLRFDIDPLGGQKTGWFFDQRPNRDRVAALAAGARVLDVFCHTGAFGLRCVASGADRVTLVDQSRPALGEAELVAARNGLRPRVELRQGDAFDAMAEAGAAGERYDIVICDPPAFAKSRKDQEAGLRAYARMTRLAARLVAPSGFLFVASCSHHAPAELFATRVAEGLAKAGRDGRIVHSGGAGPDHPVHPHLPETAYLQSKLIALD
jgi:23S rRNA (cytosine1962-C5)-methyltransferase